MKLQLILQGVVSTATFQMAIIGSGKGNAAVLSTSKESISTWMPASSSNFATMMSSTKLLGRLYQPQLLFWQRQLLQYKKSMEKYYYVRKKVWKSIVTSKGAN